jgi:hypothetical protein
MSFAQGIVGPSLILLDAEMGFQVNDDNLEKTLAKVELARNWSTRVISKLESSIRAADDEDLFRLNPLSWASQKSVD